MKTIYQTKVTAEGGRNGRVVSEDGILNFDVRVPQAMGGGGGSYTNPEQLFAAGYAACFDNALIYLARRQKLKINSKVTATVGLQETESGGFALIANLDVEIPGVEKSVAHELIAQAHATCPYSNAIRNNVNVKVSLVENQN
ncbi:MAG: organic hydroperoxide resistance protein [Bacteroidales bacterium]